MSAETAAKTSPPIPPPPLPHSLTPRTRAIYYIGAPTTTLLTALINPRLTTLVPFIAFPTILLHRLYHITLIPTPQRAANPSTLIQIYALTFTLGVPLAGLGQAVLGYSFFYLFHGRNTLKFFAEVLTQRPGDVPEYIRAARVAAVWTWQQVVQRLWVVFAMTGGLEECLKVLPVMWAVRRDRRSGPAGGQHPNQELQHHAVYKNSNHDNTHVYAYLYYGIASGLAFSTMESLAAAYGLVTGTSAGSKTWAKLALELGERIVQGTAGHVLMTTLAALRLSRSEMEGVVVAGVGSGDDAGAGLRSGPGNVGKEQGNREVRERIVSAPPEIAPTGTPPPRQTKAGVTTKRMSFFRALLPSVLYHGTFNFLLFSLSAINGDVGWVHPTDAKSLVVMYGIAIGMMGLLVWNVRWQWRELMGRRGEDKMR